MPVQSSMHLHLDWVKERLDEMNAALASLEDQARGVQAASRAKADRMLVSLRKRRLEFQEAAKVQAGISEAAWLRTKSQLETEWNSFEAQVDEFVETFGRQVEAQKTTFQIVAAAQLKAWRDATDKAHAAAAGFAAERRADIDAAVRQMKDGASAAEARLQDAARAGASSWATLTRALAQSRGAFDGALQAAADALKRAGQSRHA